MNIIFANKNLIIIIISIIMPNLHQKMLHSSPSVMVSFHGLFNAAQRWHKCIYTASVIEYFDTMDTFDAFILAFMSLLRNNRKKCHKYH